MIKFFIFELFYRWNIIQIFYLIRRFITFAVAEKQEVQKKRIRFDPISYLNSFTTQQEMANLEAEMAINAGGLFTSEEFWSWLERKFDVSYI